MAFTDVDGRDIRINGADEADADVSLIDLLTAGTSLDGNRGASQEYLDQLTALPLENLLEEPSSLQTQFHHLTSSLTSLTHTSYPTFLTLHDTTTALKTSLSSFSTSLDSLLETSLPELEECAASWRGKTENVLTQRKKARVVLDQHEKLRDLLDIPILIDTCVRNGYFAEALSLASHASSLSTTSGPTLVIVTAILAEVRQSISQMLYSLLSTLYEPSRKLPALWKAVNFLRKMDAFDSKDSEEQIGLAFITGRETCLLSNLDSVKRDILRLSSSDKLSEQEGDDMTRYLKKYVDLWREGVYDIITQFTTIFLERSSTTSASKQDDSIPPSPPQYLHTMLSNFALRALQAHLIPLLESGLSRVSLSSLPSLLTQLTYCANAFGRVGMDFRALLANVFSDAVQIGVTDQIQTSTNSFTALLKEKTGDPAPPGSLASSPISPRRRSGAGPKLPSTFLVSSANPSATSPMAVTATSIPKEFHAPPSILASFPPIADLTNALLMTLNNLRLLAPLSLQTPLASALDESLAEGGKAITVYAQAVVGNVRLTDDADEVKQIVDGALASGEAYFRVFVPFMRRALSQGVYGKVADYRVLPPSSEGDENAGERAVPEPVLQQVAKDWDTWLQSRSS